MKSTLGTLPTVNGYVDEAYAAEYLGIQKQTLSVWRLKGCGPAFYKFGRAVRYKLSELDAYAESRRCQSTGEADQL